MSGEQRVWFVRKSDNEPVAFTKIKDGSRRYSREDYRQVSAPAEIKAIDDKREADFEAESNKAKGKKQKLPKIVTQQNLLETVQALVSILKA